MRDGRSNFISVYNPCNSSWLSPSSSNVLAVGEDKGRSGRSTAGSKQDYSGNDKRDPFSMDMGAEFGATAVAWHTNHPTTHKASSYPPTISPACPAVKNCNNHHVSPILHPPDV
jgi:hypothetical protein